MCPAPTSRSAGTRWTAHPPWPGSASSTWTPRRGLLAAAIVSLRVYAGYAGWSAGQLEAEIDEGAWYVVPAQPSDAFCAEPERLWPAVLRRQGGELAYVATYPDDPGLN